MLGKQKGEKNPRYCELHNNNFPFLNKHNTIVIYIFFYIICIFFSSFPSYGIFFTGNHCLTLYNNDCYAERIWFVATVSFDDFSFVEMNQKRTCVKEKKIFQYLFAV